MRTISLTNRLEFDFTGSVLRKGLTLGDVDNDGNIEMIIGNISGDVAIFKGSDRWQTIRDLGFVSCVAVGDILNNRKNCLVILTGDGWCYVYSSDFNEDITTNRSPIGRDISTIEGVEEVDGQILSGESVESSDSCSNLERMQKQRNMLLKKIHVQRVPPNTKDVFIGDIDGDGFNEMVLGLTDRVVRSYRWYFDEPDLNSTASPTTGKLVCLNKWECAKQIGSITLHHSCDGKPSILVAQPGGTFMRIKCQVEGNLENSDSSSSNPNENLTGSTVDYQCLGISRMRNQSVSTEVLGDLNTKCIDYHDRHSISDIDSEHSLSITESSEATTVKRENSLCRGTPYAVATLDGTIMLVQDEIILWAIAVDHQIFALSKLDVTGNGLDDLVVCTWDGHTYLFDQEKNTVRFQLDESVQGFECGYYNLVAGETPVPCFAYLTFRNKILLYYDIPLKDMLCKKFDPEPALFTNILKGETLEETEETLKKLDQKSKNDLVEYLLYGIPTSF